MKRVQTCVGTARPPEARQDWGGYSLGYRRCVTHSFDVHQHKKKKKFLECFMMATVVYTNNSAEIAWAVVEIVIQGTCAKRAAIFINYL